MLTLVSCPQCDAPAEVTGHFSLASTDGPIDHVELQCAAGHHFKMPSEKLPALEQGQLRVDRRASRPLML